MARKGLTGENRGCVAMIGLAGFFCGDEGMGTAEGRTKSGVLTTNEIYQKTKRDVKCTGSH